MGVIACLQDCVLIRNISDCVQYLLSNDAKTDLHEHYSGGTALHGAAVEGRTTVVQLLISADTAQSFQLVDAEGETALMHGARKGFANVCKMIDYIFIVS